MAIKKAVGRPSKLTFKLVARLSDAIAHNTNITDACRYAGISRQTYYHYLNSEEVFAEEMNRARQRQREVVFSFLTTW